jgi:hypothetical protein
MKIPSNFLFIFFTILTATSAFKMLYRESKFRAFGWIYKDYEREYNKIMKVYDPLFQKNFNWGIDTYGPKVRELNTQLSEKNFKVQKATQDCNDQFATQKSIYDTQKLPYDLTQLTQKFDCGKFQRLDKYDTKLPDLQKAWVKIFNDNNKALEPLKADSEWYAAKLEQLRNNKQAKPELKPEKLSQLVLPDDPEPNNVKVPELKWEPANTA